MWLGMCCRWPASGTRPRSRSAAGSASSGRADISMRGCKVQHAGVLRPARRRERVVENPLGLDDARPRRRLAGRGVPQRPGGDVQQRVGGQRLHVEVVGVRRGQGDHRVGVGGVTGGQGSASSGSSREAGRSASIRSRSTRRRSGRALARRTRRARGRASDAAQVDRVERVPRLVVVRPDRVGDAPAREREVRVGASARSKQRIASSWLKAYAQTSPRSNQACASTESVSTGRRWLPRS